MVDSTKKQFIKAEGACVLIVPDPEIFPLVPPAKEDVAAAVDASVVTSTAQVYAAPGQMVGAGVIVQNGPRVSGNITEGIYAYFDIETCRWFYDTNTKQRLIVVPEANIFATRRIMEKVDTRQAAEMLQPRFQG